MSFVYPFTKDSVLLKKLESEINEDVDISQDALYSTWDNPDELKVYFELELTASEQTELQALVTAHDPTPLDIPDYTTVVDKIKSGTVAIEAIDNGVKVVTFETPFVDANYRICFTGDNVGGTNWSNKTASGFTANASSSLWTGDVDWIANHDYEEG